MYCGNRTPQALFLTEWLFSGLYHWHQALKSNRELLWSPTGRHRTWSCASKAHSSDWSQEGAERWVCILAKDTLGVYTWRSHRTTKIIITFKSVSLQIWKPSVHRWQLWGEVLVLRERSRGPLDVQNIREIQTQEKARTLTKILFLQNIAVLMSLLTQLWPESPRAVISTPPQALAQLQHMDKLKPIKTMSSPKRTHLGPRGVWPLNCAQSEQVEWHRWTEVGHFSAITVRTRLVPWVGH